MPKDKNQLYESIKDLKTKKQFEEEIKKRQKEYDDLLDENTTALLIVDELGRNKQNISKIKDLKPGLECTVYGRVTKINKSKSFTRKNGSVGNVVNIELTDDTEKCTLVLWNKNVDLVKNKEIKIGTNLKIINGYTKDGFNGLELNVGQWGLLEIEPDDMPKITEEKQPVESENTISGTLIEIQPTRAFFKDDGEFGFVTNIKIRGKEGVKQLVLWGEKVKEVQRFKQGDTIEINNISTRQKNGEQEAHVNGRSNIKKL